MWAQDVDRESFLAQKEELFPRKKLLKKRWNRTNGGFVGLGSNHSKNG